MAQIARTGYAGGRLARQILVTHPILRAASWAALTGTDELSDDCPAETIQMFLPLTAGRDADDLAAVVHRRYSQTRAFFRTQLLPGNDICVVLEPGDNDLVVNRRQAWIYLYRAIAGLEVE